MDPEFGTVEAIAVTGETITAVGSADEIAIYIGADTQVIDLAGNTLIPGFVDAHTHVLTDMGGIEAGQPLALEVGITSLGDAHIEQGWPEQFIDASDRGVLKVRTSLYLGRMDPCGVDEGFWYDEYPPDAVLGDRLRIGGVKLFNDGGSCANIAASEEILDDYFVQEPFHDVETLAALIGEADAAGYQVIVHSQGDLAIAVVQDAYEQVLDGRENVLHHRIEHNAFLTEEVVGRYSEIGIIPTMFGISSACVADIGWTDFYKEYGDRPGLIVDANPDLIVAWHGDDPSLLPVSPIIELFNLVTRSNIAEDGSLCEAPDWMADGGVTVEQGLAMMTINAAYALRQEDVVGSLTPGKLADLVVLTGNPLTVPSSEIPGIGVLATIIGGVTEYCASGMDEFCSGVVPPEVPEASASMSRDGQGPELAFDGSIDPESFWSSGADAPQWIQYAFPEPVSLAELAFTVYQNPPGSTVHSLEVMVGGEWTLVETFDGPTETGQILRWTPDAAIDGVEAFRMTTVESLSWPEWFEIGIGISK